MTEKLQTELNKSVLVQEGDQSSELVVPEVPSIGPVRTVTPEVPVNTDSIQVSLDDAVSKDRVGYDSPEIKGKVQSTLSPSQAADWSSLFQIKEQGKEIRSL